MIKIKKIIPAIIIIFIIILSVGYATGIRINFTTSFPRGLYYSKKIKSGNLNDYRDKLVGFCPDPANPVIHRAEEWHITTSGFCPGGTMPFVKKLVGLPGDTITVDTTGVRVNGQPIKNSRLKFKNFELLIHPGYHQTLKPGEYWVMSDYNPNSLDSRYFGPVKRPVITRTASPLILIEK